MFGVGNNCIVKSIFLSTRKEESLEVSKWEQKVFKRFCNRLWFVLGIVVWVDIEPLLVSNKTPWLARQSPEGSLRKACKEKRKNRFFKTYTTKIQFILLGQPKQATGNGRTLDLILLIIEVKVPLGKNGVILMGLSLAQCMEKMRERSPSNREKKTGQTGSDLKYFIATMIHSMQFTKENTSITSIGTAK